MLGHVHSRPARGTRTCDRLNCSGPSIGPHSLRHTPCFVADIPRMRPEKPFQPVPSRCPSYRFPDCKICGVYRRQYSSRHHGSCSHDCAAATGVYLLLPPTAPAEGNQACKHWCGLDKISPLVCGAYIVLRVCTSLTARWDYLPGPRRLRTGSPDVSRHSYPGVSLCSIRKGTYRGREARTPVGYTIEGRFAQIKQGACYSEVRSHPDIARITNSVFSRIYLHWT